jgi:predicted MFS family arabinose efflux permease
MRRGLHVLRERNFRLVYGAQVVSLLGDGIIPVALAFAILDLTGSATDLGLVLAARTIPLVACLLAGGVAADRLSRRRVMIAADAARFASQGLLGVLLVTGEAHLWQLALLQAVLGAASGFFNPASTGLIPMVVSDERLQDANALRGFALAVGGVAGPVVAGVLVAVLGPGQALLADAGTYALSAALLARVHVQETRSHAPPESFLADLRAGWREVWSRAWVRSIIGVFSLANVFIAPFFVLGPLVAKRQLGGAAAWAGILAARGAGEVLGALVSLQMRPRRPLLVAVLACLLGSLPTALLATGAPAAVIAVTACAAGAGIMVFNTLWETTLQRHVPPQALSRVSAYDWFGSLTFQPIGFAIVGPLAAGLGMAATLWAAAALQFVLVSALLAVRDVRTLEGGSASAPRAPAAAGAP